ncbi:MAG: threonine synthase [SAR202 cluster bacterium]|jgi:threonine synthase|nr:threonine synthase [SAR202 cluster bacterium]MQG70662.1 threonine synthase [SAR202 cluster bacterium]HAL47334.1 threonine synthase [Dehalococcoidia bacterium]|tara:strand:+ start:3260 stop:4498 length:1239 start_codon:yes stop_codon:yes gene_type:complete
MEALELSHVKCLRCRGCEREYPVEPLNACDFCFGPLEVEYDYEAISEAVSRESISQGPNTMWRYHDFLPVDAELALDMGTGFTPLIKAENLGRRLGLENLYVKNDSVNPTFSFKDRVVSVASAKALEFEFDTLACASTGNLMGAVAAHGAKASMNTMVFFPADVEKGKIVGAGIYGATLIAVDGTYDQVNRLCSELADNHRWAFVNVNMRPFYAEGSKTLGYEVAEQLGWTAPQHCIVPGASGALFTKIYKGLNEMVDAGLIAPISTKMHIAQAEGCSPIVEAYNLGETEVRPVRPNTLAKSLAIGNPADGPYALRTIAASEGSAVMAMEDEIVEGIQILAETEGIFTETAGGVVISGLRRLVKNGLIKPDELTVAYITGNGLKTQEVVESAIKPVHITPSYDAFEEAMAGR